MNRGLNNHNNGALVYSGEESINASNHNLTGNVLSGYARCEVDWRQSLVLTHTDVPFLLYFLYHLLELSRRLLNPGSNLFWIESAFAPWSRTVIQSHYSLGFPVIKPVVQCERDSRRKYPAFEQCFSFDCSTKCNDHVAALDDNGFADRDVAASAKFPERLLAWIASPPLIDNWDSLTYFSWFV